VPLVLIFDTPWISRETLFVDDVLVSKQKTYYTIWNQEITKGAVSNILGKINTLDIKHMMIRLCAQVLSSLPSTLGILLLILFNGFY